MWTSWTMQNKSIWFYGTPCRKLLKQFLILYKYKSSLQNQSFVRGERENPVTSLCKSPLANAVQVKYQVWQIYQYFIIIMIWDHQDVVLFMCNLFLVFHLFILTCCVWYFALCFLVLTSPKPGLLCLVWVLIVYSVKMTFRVSCFCFVCRNFHPVNDCVTSVTHHPYLQGSTAPAQARRLGCSTGTFCLLSLPGSATYGRAPVGRRRTESQEDRSGAGGWWGGKKTCQHLKTWIWAQYSSDHSHPSEQQVGFFFLPEGGVSWNVWLCSQVAFIQTATTHGKLHENRTTHL